jgi:hypothetical protein
MSIRAGSTPSTAGPHSGVRPGIPPAFLFDREVDVRLERMDEGGKGRVIPIAAGSAPRGMRGQAEGPEGRGAPVPSISIRVSPGFTRSPSCT